MVKQQAVRLVSGTRIESVARMSYAAVMDHMPSVFLSPGALKSRAYDRLTVRIAAQVLPPCGNSIDVGAHCGSILRHLVKLSPAGHHWAFEPIPNLAAQLRTRYPSVHVEQLAIADYSGRAEFHFIPAASAHSSLLVRPQVELGREVQHLPVSVRLLDSVIPEHVPIAFMKIDVEGSEAAVLRGAAQLLRNWRPVVVFECDPTELTSCIPILREANLRLSLLSDFLAGRARAIGEVVSQGYAHHEYYYVASP